MASPSVILIGASGWLGNYVSLEFLRNRSSFTRLAILTEEHKRHKFADVEAKGFELIIGSYTDAASFKGFDTVISLLGNLVMKDQPAIIDAAIAAGVTEFYPSEYGSDGHQGEFLSNGYWREKQRTVAHLRAVVPQHASFNYSVVMTGHFVEFALMPLFGVDIAKHTFELYGSPGRAGEWTSARDAAKYIVQSTLLPKSESRERWFRVPGGLYTWREVIATLEKVQGVKYTCTYLSQQEAVDKAEACRKAGDVDGELAFLLKKNLGELGVVGVPQPWDNEVFGFEPEGFEQAVRRILEERSEGLQE
ncbi:NAD(P)-binding protein [Mytilinidion resinicola]|uniref:NAD(P)-binding protein n=1 Tax=Mytilinidion resinicola TaxID=574789 RepID=A0A6A6Y732_9PEZI|nr:NAD(P)-binding protein [Mytilinidion resinicola]KAF2804626.1 NAD(P)-binding protein [Mytilinidion resinicola]